MIALLTALTGGLGAAARFLLDTVIARHNRLSVPIGTVLVNVTACFLLGVLTGLVLGDSDLGEVKAVLGVGFLGGYSTFSTASVEGARLVLQRRYGQAIAHSGGMLVLSLAAATLGVVLALP
ncbi:fluoride efflux transporter FluC [Georgenia thermotolerans]|uniref:Fluoride-specific ion channel FluC n=1 Tax=Georgenia thermotolerans TaxID=527326 RepID=A0A7J5USY6_9MICO|nr:CrcB family protein [Georgenia thermotolerans]KAE8764963.1 camphor resistance protein CrcB [Georgenia thermotolerans]